MKKLKQILWIVPLVVMFMANVSWGVDVTGDFQSKAAGPNNWSAYTSWNRYNGSLWVAAVSGEVPTSTSAVTIQTGHTMNIDDGTAVCGNLSFTTTGAINFNSASSVLSVYGNATFGTAKTNISAWTSGAKLVFTGTATQTWTTGTDSRFDAIEINKSSGTLTQSTGSSIRIGSSLTVTGGGTFALGSGTDIEGVQFANGTTATFLTITVSVGSTFNMDAGAASYIRSGISGTAAIGSVTVYGTMNLSTTSGTGLQFGAVTVGD